MILDLIQNPHYVIDIDSFEGIRNIIVTIFLFISILILGRNLSKSKNLLLLKIICTVAFISTGYDHIIDVLNGNWRIEEDLPLHLCSLSNLIVILVLFTPINKKIFEFLLGTEEYIYKITKEATDKIYKVI